MHLVGELVSNTENMRLLDNSLLSHIDEGASALNHNNSNLSGHTRNSITKEKNNNFIAVIHTPAALEVNAQQNPDISQ
jgi:hypothetical protein